MDGAEEGERERLGVGAGPDPAQLLLGIEIRGELLLDVAQSARAAGGVRQRRAQFRLLGDPEVLVLDEPANGLDPAGVLWLRGFLRRLGDEGRTVLVSSHILAEVAQFADRAVVIDHGRLVAAGPVTELVKAARQAIVIRTPRAGTLRAALTSEGASVRAAGPDRLEITGMGTEQVATLAAALGIPIFEMTADTGHLEEAFLRLTATEGRPG